MNNSLLRLLLIQILCEFLKDWLDKLNLKEPTNIEEFTAMLKAFTEGDPDGNNKKDTVGLTGSKIRDWFNIIFAGFGVKPEWNKNANGVFEPGYATEAYKQFLGWMQEQYKAGYIQKEYYLNDDAQKEEAFYSGKAGVMITNSGAKADGVIKQIGAVNSSAVVDSLTPPDGPGGKGSVFSFGGYWGGWSISISGRRRGSNTFWLGRSKRKDGNRMTESYRSVILPCCFRKSACSTVYPGEEKEATRPRVVSLPNMRN
ncbi:extracellular solute-binding protein [Paenibacillus eucommiae]|uniref:Extracellular solute-binding protein n=1 Tax=Paenibacillus eucommiae TaxID=1355755 RepID=A0ABS4ISM0_9BACL|nr:extracellular solute-binding protein [Paenibacillus eucommiae]MBP1989579.1 hypothetical protein [Paenibacillus eucommiae]